MQSKELAAIAIVFSADETELLLVKRRDTPIWVLPGGGVEEGETPAAAAEREAYEETGVRVKIERLVGKYTPINKMGRVTYVFACKRLEGNPISTEESLATGFFPLSNLPKPFFFLHQEWVRDAIAHHPTPLEKPLKSVTYWNLLKLLLCHPLIVSRYFLSRLGLPWNSR